MRTHVKLLALIIIVIYGIGIVLAAGNLPNQTATLVAVDETVILSLADTENYTRQNVTLRPEAWVVLGGNQTYENGALIVEGTYENATAPFFVAKNSEIDQNLTSTPYIHIVVTSTPDTRLSFHVGIRDLDSRTLSRLLNQSCSIVTENDTANRMTWLNISYPQYGEMIDDKYHHITIDVAEKMTEFGLHDQNIEGLQIRQYLVGFIPSFPSNHYRTVFESIDFSKEIPYTVTEADGASRALLDGSVAHVVRGSCTWTDLKSFPHLQRVYISYKMDAPQDTMYTIFLLFKRAGNLSAQRCGFVFTHNKALNEIGTYIDWRRLVELDHQFEPISTLARVMEEGDCAFVFAPLKENRVQGVQLSKIVFTYSKLPYSAFIISGINEETLIMASISILTVAGILPTSLMFYLFYLQRKSRLSDGRGTIGRILLVGLGLRLILALFTAYADDTQIFSEIGAIYFGSGVLGAQWVSLPGFVYLETAAYFPYALLRAAGFQDFQFLALDIYSVEALFTKLPAILSDFGSFFFIMKMAEKHVPQKKVLLPALYLLNPLTTYISGILGQFDSIFAFALIASIYYLVTKFDGLKASVFSSFAAILNPVGIATFIPLFSNLNLRENWRKITICLAVVLVIFVGSLLPFFFEGRSPVIISSIQRVLGGIPGEPFYGKQIDFYLYGTLIISSVGYGLTFRFFLEIIGFQLGPAFYPYGAGVVFIIFVGIFLYKMHKMHNKKPNRMVYTGTFMLGVASIFQLAFPTIFDQFAIWIAALLLVSYVLIEDRKLIVLFTIICIANGFIYVVMWRNYLQLISGVEAVPLGNAALANMGSAVLGVLYSSVLVIVTAIVLRMWLQEKSTIRLGE